MPEAQGSAHLRLTIVGIVVLSLFAALTARARRLYASALAGFRATDQLVDAARVMNNLGLSMAEEKAFFEAIDWYEQAAETALALCQG